MGHYRGRAEIIQGAKRIGVDCAYDGGTDPRSGLHAWAGVYRGARPPHVLEPDSALLRLPDGREGEILIDEIDSSTGASGLFLGNGPEPTSPPSGSDS